MNGSSHSAADVTGGNGGNGGGGGEIESPGPSVTPTSSSGGGGLTAAAAAAQAAAAQAAQHSANAAMRLPFQSAAAVSGFNSMYPSISQPIGSMATDSYW